MQKEQQHTVSGSYLENFSDERGHVWVLDTDDKIFNVNPDNILKERHFYSLTSKDGKKDFTVEDTLCAIEGDYINVFRNKLSKDLFLADEERIMVSVFIAALMTRTRPYRDSLKSLFREIKDWMEDWTSQPKQESEDRILEAIPSGKGPTIDLDTLKKGLKNFEEHHSASILRTLSHSAALIYHMKWSVWINKHHGFVTSDNPVVLLKPPGLRWKDVELTVPLSKDRLLLAGWILNDDSYITVDDEMARRMDHRTITHSCDRIIANSNARLEDIKSKYTDKPYKSKAFSKTI